MKGRTVTLAGDWLLACLVLRSGYRRTWQLARRPNVCPQSKNKKGRDMIVFRWKAKSP